MQISAIVLYGKNWIRRVIPFKCGAVNIITGKSKTGKSVIGDIIDYALVDHPVISQKVLFASMLLGMVCN